MENHTIDAAARILGVHRDTLRRYERLGLVIPQRDSNGWRRYDDAQLDALAAAVRAEVAKGNLLFASTPEVRHRPLRCECGREWEGGDLILDEATYRCPRCRSDVIHTNSVAGVQQSAV